jgi:hypothetical protein
MNGRTSFRSAGESSEEWIIMAVRSVSATDALGIVNEWKQRLEELENQVSSWVETRAGWQVQRSTKEVSEAPLGSYQVDVLTITDKKERRLVLEPIARFSLTGNGIVELYAWPSLNRVRLVPVQSGAAWDVWTDSGIKLRQPWGRDTFIDLAGDLMSS